MFILNISRNSLAAIDGLKKLNSLAIVNVAHNRISDISSVGICESLIWIVAQANDIGNVICLRPLGRLASLKLLSLQSIKKDHIKPV